jgi:hypothetical protein
MKKYADLPLAARVLSIAAPAFASAVAINGCLHLGPNGFSATGSGTPEPTPAPAATPAASAAASAPAPAAPEKIAYEAHATNSGNRFTDRFFELWNDIHNPSNGYFSAEGVPYHAVETLLSEAPDYGHETTSEAYSYWIWLEAMYGKLSKDWKYLDHAWSNLEHNIIPSQEDQPTNKAYNPNHPATYAPEHEQPNGYPSSLDNAVPVGSDPIYDELKTTYGNSDVYGMHWIIDVDNWYGYGRRGDGVTRPSYFNTFQRGPQESVFETIPQPSWDDFKWGSANGYVDLFVKSPGGAARQWRYTDAPDADARAIGAVYWATVWAAADGQADKVKAVAQKAGKLGDFLRYALFDKYFKTIGCKETSCPGARDYTSAHYLLSWYYAWGGSISTSGSWAFRIGASASHSGYQNPLTAYALSQVAEVKPASPNAARDWGTSLSRQLEFYRWLQSAEGGIAGGASNGWNGRYEAPPAGAPTFYGLTYDWQPVYHDPPSNEWFGFQAWSMDRVAQYYYVTGDERAKTLLDRWAGWVKSNTRLKNDGTYEVPSTLDWTGQPSGNWDAAHQDFKANDKGYNAGLHVKVKAWGNDPGVAAATARTLAYYAAKSGDAASKKLAGELLDRMWAKYRDGKGISTPEARTDYKRFKDAVYVPAGWTGKMPNGDVVDSSATFISIRSKYKSDPDWGKVQAFLDGGPAPIFHYHRFWAESDIALANAVYGSLFPPPPGSEPKPAEAAADSKHGKAESKEQAAAPDTAKGRKDKPKKKKK